MTVLKIGTRKSPLAVWQAEHVKAGLLRAHEGLEIELVKIVTEGDRILDVPLANIGGKALFVKEIEERLLQGDIDIAVHSMKDVPTVLPDSLGLIATLARGDPTDAYVARTPGEHPTLDSLPDGARVGTSSLRRMVQLRARRPDLDIASVRGNVGTRLQKLDDGAFDALLLATAGLERLELSHRITQRLDVDVCLPAVGQGALAIEGRLDDAATLALVEVLQDRDTERCVAAERAFLGRIEGSCQVPVGGYAVPDSGGIILRVLIGRLDGSQVIRGERRGGADEAERVGERLADDLLDRGAREILAEIFAAAAAG